MVGEGEEVIMGKVNPLFLTSNKLSCSKTGLDRNVWMLFLEKAETEQHCVSLKKGKY